MHFVSGVYKLADICESGLDMISHRLSLLKQAMLDLLKEIAEEHFGQQGGSAPKMPLVFKINNLHFIVVRLREMMLTKCTKDLAAFDKELQQYIE